MAQLNAMTLTELKSLEKKVVKAIAKFEEREKKKALSTLKAKAREMGFSLDELTAAQPKAPAAKKPAKKVPPKYANPDDPTQTWTGRGRRPVWVTQALEAGKSIDDLSI
ncbi:H-NS histone family protein [Marimonas arenosa]|uniref:H-NS histone family protein n=2 Tax=Marimonas arenosa TaxID=1795305 RepID=A0AAE3WCB5_9RHOB|nr:H-NS histone family protein [Marimonas arenosa]